MYLSKCMRVSKFKPNNEQEKTELDSDRLNLETIIVNPIWGEELNIRNNRDIKGPTLQDIAEHEGSRDILHGELTPHSARIGGYSPASSFKPDTPQLFKREMDLSFQAVDDSINSYNPHTPQRIKTLHQLAGSNDLHKIKILIQKKPEKTSELQSADIEGNLPVHIAAQKECSGELIKYLIQKTADKTALGKGNLTPLEMALNRQLFGNAKIIYETLFPKEQISEGELITLREILVEIRKSFGVVEILPMSKMKEFIIILRDLKSYGYKFAEGDLQIYYLKDIRDLIQELRKTGYMTGKAGNYPKMYFQFLIENGKKLQSGQFIIYLYFLLYMGIIVALTYGFSYTKDDGKGDISYYAHIVFGVFIGLTVLFEGLLFHKIIGKINNDEKAVHFGHKFCLSQDFEAFISGVLGRIDTYTDLAFIMIAYKCESNILGMIALSAFIVSYGIPILFFHFRSAIITRCHPSSVRMFHEMCLLAEFRALAFRAMDRMCKRRIYERDVAYSSVWKFCTEDAIQLVLQILYLYNSKVGSEEIFILFSSILSGFIAFACMLQSISEAIVIYHENHGVATQKHSNALLLISAEHYAVAYKELKSEQRLLNILGKQIYPDMIENLSLQGQVLNHLGRRKEMLEPLEEALRISNALYGPVHSKSAQASNNLAQIYLLNNRLNEVHKLLKISYKIILETYGLNHKFSMACVITKANYLKKKGMLLAERGEKEKSLQTINKAKEEYDKALEIAKEVAGNISEEMAHIFTNYASLYSDYYKENKMAISFTEKAMRIRKLLRKEGEGSQGDYETGLLYRNKGNFAKEDMNYADAKHYFKESNKEFQTMSPPHLLGVLKNLKSMGNILYDEHRYHEAIRTFKDGKTLYQTLNLEERNQDLLIELEEGIRDAYGEQGDYQSALDTSNTLLLLYLEQGSNQGRARVINRTLDYLDSLNRFEEEVKKGYELINLYNSFNAHQYIIGELYTQIGMVLYEQLRRFKEAIQCGDKALLAFQMDTSHIDQLEMDENKHFASQLIQLSKDLLKNDLADSLREIETLS